MSRSPFDRVAEPLHAKLGHIRGREAICRSLPDLVSKNSWQNREYLAETVFSLHSVPLIESAGGLVRDVSCSWSGMGIIIAWILGCPEPVYDGRLPI